MTSDARTRVIDLLALAERAIREGPVEEAEVSEATELAVRKVRAACWDAQHEISPDRRPSIAQRDLLFAYNHSKLPNLTSRSGAVGEPSTRGPGLVRAYDSLFAKTVPSAEQLAKSASAWTAKSGVSRMLSKSSRPPAPTQELLDDLATLVDWAAKIASDKRTILDREAVREEAVIRAATDEHLEAIRAVRAALLRETLEVKLTTVVNEGGLTMAEWTDPRWSSAGQPGALPTDLRLGDFTSEEPALANVNAPATLAFPFRHGLVIDQDTQSRARSVELARALCIRILAAVKPGGLRFTFIDPVSLGQSVAEFQHLADFDPDLVDTRPITNARDIEAKLADLSAGLETVISKYLRGQFESIDEYNLVAGELAEPYRVLVVFDYPAGFSDSAAQQLLSLIDNGPRCGLHTVILTDVQREQPRDLPLERLRHGLNRLSWLDSRVRLTLDDGGTLDRTIVPDQSPPLTFGTDGSPTTPFASLLVSVGEGSRVQGSESVTLDRLLPVLARMTVLGRNQNVPQMESGSGPITSDPSTWWNASSASGTIAPLGKSGAQDVTSLYFSSTEIAGGAIMVGLPRSGKTTSLHSAILTMCMLYGPEELELFLIDAKHGVEFKIYESLPHARMVSINSEREFSVAVLNSLDQEIARRAELMKSRSAGRANISEYRTATGDAMPRIVLIMDEFHEIFEEDDALGHEAFQAFSNIIRQGPFAGVHVVAASQTLSSMPALDRPTLQLLPERVAFMCNETDADLVMGDSNRGTRLLNKQGQGLFNPSRGEPSQNKPFQGLFIPPAQREAILEQIADLARLRAWDRRPRVFDGDTPAARPQSATAGSPSRLTIPIGEPFTLGAAVVIVLRRSRGSNIVVIGDTDDDGVTDFSARGVLHSCILAAAHSSASLDVIDFIGDEIAGPYPSIAYVGKTFDTGYHRSRQFAPVLNELAAKVDARLRAGDYTAKTQLLVLFGVQRALSLKPVDPYGDQSESQSAVDLARIIRDGPEVGIHVVVAVDSTATFTRRIGNDLSEDFGFRVGSAACSPNDLQFVAGGYTAPPEVRRNQLLLGDQQRGTTTRLRAYNPITTDELSTQRRVP